MTEDADGSVVDACGYEPSRLMEERRFEDALRAAQCVLDHARDLPGDVVEQASDLQQRAKDSLQETQAVEEETTE